MITLEAQLKMQDVLVVLIGMRRKYVRIKVWAGMNFHHM
ncbi:hypothetical protein PssB301D_04707 [Pseudomonas syringae pv. syringae str. B301D-R]|nr:hypothetical protein PsyrB_26100 [Pseudomonas syringae pv. syringae B301D]EXL29111.1 hypothetical protein PssB301D_04707 [Pseudomonas syringae pv. syringae str. B301D-R]SOQ04588.1 hypothetical protein CFBP2118_05060 [Pseudomonas syringae pv. syringae]